MAAQRTVRWRGAGALGIALAVTGGSAACAPGRERAAESIDAAIAAMPGVASSTSEYDSGWPRGNERFGLTAVLRDNATPDQARALGKAFADRVNTDLAGLDAEFEVKYRVVDRVNGVPLTSAAGFDNPDGAAERLQEWLAVAQSPGVQSTRFSGRDGTVAVTVEQSATDTDLQNLVAAHPGLDQAEWVVVGGSPAETSIYSDTFPEVYRVRGRIPDASLREVWTRIVAEVGGTGQITAETDMARKDIPTTVELNFPTSRDNEQGIAQAWMALPLLAKLPQPSRVDFDGAVFIIGGCSPREPNRNAEPLEAELRQKYEKC